MIDNPVGRIQDFVKYVRTHLTGDEKGEAHLFCDRLMQAFGHAGIREAGGALEFRIHEGKTTKFADLLWRPRLLLEMKKRGERLDRHYRQAFEYWLHLVPQRPEYVVLCNFDEFWIYDLDEQLDEPMDKVGLDELPDRFSALNFLFPEKRKPLFNNDRVAVTRAAADKVAQVFNALVKRGEKREVAQRFVLQCVVALFAEDIDLLPRNLFTEILVKCREGASSYDLIGGLFNQMNSRTPARGGSYQGVGYFNGGLFANVNPIELTTDELDLLFEAARENWSKVQPPIFGGLFEGSMDQRERHAFGAHFTSEADIQKVVLPTIVRPWRERIAATKTAKELIALREEQLHFKVLDPACGSGNFLYVAYREMKRVELELLDKIETEYGKKTRKLAGRASLVSASQFYGLDIKPFAVELAKVTLMLAKELALKETLGALKSGERHLPFDLHEQALPLDNLDENVRCVDALFEEWPKVDAIIGNPPYQSKNKMQQEYGPEYLKKLRGKYPGVPGRADYCVFWFRRAHDELPPGGRAGLVGTNTIRQNYSREGGLDHIVANGGTITEAVSTQVWSGEAAVHVSIVNWVKGKQAGRKKLFFQKGDHHDSPWEVVDVDEINAALSAGVDVTSARRLQTNIESCGCYQGQTHGHEGFLLTIDEAEDLIQQDAKNHEVLFPYLTGDELIATPAARPARYVIDFQSRDVLAARAYTGPIARVEKLVLPARQRAAEEEEERNASSLSSDPKAKVNHHHRNFLNRWWLLAWGRQELTTKLGRIPRFVACSRVTKRPIFEFVSSRIRPSDVVMAFPLPDDYSFGILQSGVHWAWFVATCSTLKRDFRYTSDTVFDTFPWPQDPGLRQVQAIAAAAVDLRALRRKVMIDNGWSLRDLYRTLDSPGKNPLRDAHEQLDSAVRAAYGMKPREDPLAFLLELNGRLAEAEKAGDKIVAPGLPPCVKNADAFVTEDCVRMEPKSRVAIAGPSTGDKAEPLRAPFQRVEGEPKARYRTCVPIYSLKAAAGAFGQAQEVEPEGWAEPATKRKLRKGMFVARVVGKSMEPEIPDGAWCLFASPVEGGRDGKTVLVAHRDIRDPETAASWTVKRYRSTKRREADGAWRHVEIRLEPANPAFAPIVLTGVDEGDVAVVAEAVEVLGAGAATRLDE